jgi:hypothetical protein
MYPRISLVLEDSGNVARDHLASERTFLSYVRASLTIVSAAVGECLLPSHGKLFRSRRSHERSSPRTAAFTPGATEKPGPCSLAAVGEVCPPTRRGDNNRRATGPLRGCVDELIFVFRDFNPAEQVYSVILPFREHSRRESFPLHASGSDSLRWRWERLS